MTPHAPRIVLRGERLRVTHLPGPDLADLLETPGQFALPLLFLGGAPECCDAQCHGFLVDEPRGFVRLLPRDAARNIRQIDSEVAEPREDLRLAGDVPDVVGMALEKAFAHPPHLLEF